MIDCRLVLFDLDDTLYDFGYYWELAVKETLRRSPSSADLEIEPTPSTVDLLTKLRAQVPLGIVTNGPADQQMKKVERLGLSDLFPRDTVFISGEIGVHKPHPLIFEKALVRSG